MAHEVVHLLDPAVDGSSVLEEGIATAFQADMALQEGRNYRMDHAGYLEAERLARLVLASDPAAIAEIRSTGVRFSKIDSATLLATVPGLSPNDADILCRPCAALGI